MKVFKMSFFFAMLILFVSCAQEQERRDGYKVVWEEDFKSSKKLEENWSKIPRGEADTDKYMSDYEGLYEVSNGTLILRGMKNTVLPSDPSPYLTGGLYTKDKRVFNEGRIEIKAKLFGARSAWPALWLLPEADVKWPQGGEIDIMERLGTDGYIYQTVHSDYTVVQDIKDDPKSGIVAHLNLDKYNVYAVELFADSLKFFVNDTHTFTYPRIETDKSGQFPFSDNKYYLLIDMHLGGNWAGPVNEQDLPAEIHIDWVRHLVKQKEE